MLRGEGKLRNRSLALLVTTIFVISLSRPVLSYYPPPLAKVYVDPQESFVAPGESFSIDVILEDVVTLYGWEAKLFWDNSLLNCTDEEYPIFPVGLNWESPNSLLLGPGIEQDFNATHGRWYHGLSALPMAAPMPEPFTGTIKLVTLTFEAIAVGSCDLILLDVALRGRDTTTTTVYPRWSDINDDGVVDIFDVVIVAGAFGSEPGDPNWNLNADLNDDGKVDITDVVIVSSDFGKSAGDPFWGVTYMVYDIPLFACMHGKVTITATRVCVNPQVSSAGLGGTFSVDVVLENVANLLGWEAKLFWDNSILECTGEGYPILPPGCNWDTPNHLKSGPGVQNGYNSTHGRWYRDLAALPMASPYPKPFTGTIRLVTLTFCVKAQGSCTLDLQGTKLANSQAMSIPHTTEDGYFVSRIPVGGVWTPINKLDLLAPWIGLTSLITVATVSVGYAKRRKKKQT